MMRSLSRLQWILIVGAVALAVVLYQLEIQTPNTKKAAANDKAQPSTELDIEKLKVQAGQALPEEAKTVIQKLETALKESDASEKLKATEELANSYFAYKQFALAGMLFELNANQQQTASSFVTAANAFRDAYRNSNDSNLTPLLVKKAEDNYQSALKLEPSNLDAKTGLGACYVDASQNPMQGIQLLLEVVKIAPDNVNANTNLGLFSMRSGQYEKAVGRFETVVKKAPSAENYAMLAEAYEQSGDKKNAIAALKKAKEYVLDPQILKGIDDYIKNLEN